jgi:hypothetical protein
MKFRKHLILFVIEKISVSQLPSVGLIGLEEGFNSSSLNILAGLNKDEPYSVKIEYFEKALYELNIKLPNKREAVIEYAILIIEEILNGKMELIEGISEIKCNSIDKYNFFDNNKVYRYDSIGFELIFSLYVEHSDLIIAEEQFLKDKSNKELLTEIENELMYELKKWIEYLKNNEIE